MWGWRGCGGGGGDSNIRGNITHSIGGRCRVYDGRVGENPVCLAGVRVRAC